MAPCFCLNREEISACSSFFARVSYSDFWERKILWLLEIMNSKMILMKSGIFRERKILWLLKIMNTKMILMKSGILKVKKAMMKLKGTHPVMWTLKKIVKRHDQHVDELLDEAYERFIAKKEGSAKQRKRSKQAYSNDDQLLKLKTKNESM